MTRGVEAGQVSAATARYLTMQREAYADLAIQSTYGDGTLVPSDGEFVVGSYAAHEQFDYERWLLTGVRLGEGSVALEYGCGPGRMLLRLAHWFHRVDGIDISREVLDIAARRTAHLPVKARAAVDAVTTIAEQGGARRRTPTPRVSARHSKV